MEPTYIYGRHAVIEALKKRPDIIDTMYIRPSILGEAGVQSLLKQVKNVVEFDERKLPRGVARDAVHQGLIASVVIDRLVVPFKEFKKTLEVGLDTGLAVLGEVQDPHNVGAIIRSAAAFGIGAVLLPEHRGCPITGTVIKVSTGTAFSVPLVEVKNINAALRELKDMGFWVYGLDMEGDSTLPEEDFRRPSVFVVGNEGDGMREKTKELCDTVLTIPMHPRAESLNASVSAATVMYAWSTVHPKALG